MKQLHVRVVKKGRSIRWQVLTANSKVLLTSEPCKSITGAQKAANSFAIGMMLKLPVNVQPPIACYWQPSEVKVIQH